MPASLIGRLGSSAFRPPTTTMSMSLAGSCFSSESAPRPFHHGIRGRGGTIFWSALLSEGRQVQETERTHFSTRPFGVKHCQSIHHYNVDVARGLVLLFGIGTKALPSWDSRTRWHNLLVGLAVGGTAGPRDRTNSLLYTAVWGQALSVYPPLQCRCRSRARASLRNRHQGPSIMGFEDEVAQSFGRPCCRRDGRSKRPNELTSLHGRLGSSTVSLSTTTMSMSLAGSCFSSESAPRPFHHGI